MSTMSNPTEAQHPSVDLLLQEVSRIAQASAVERVNLELAHRAEVERLHASITALQSEVDRLSAPEGDTGTD